MEKSNATDLINSYKQASSDIIELVEDYNDYSAIKDIKQILNSK